MKYVAKYRLSDGGVVDVWKGPDQVPQSDAAGRPLYTEESNYSLGEKTLARLGFVNKFKPAKKPLLGDPVPMLVTRGQSAVEISEREYVGLGTIAEANGRLRWRIERGRLVPNDREIYVTERIEPSSEPVKGEIDLQALGRLSMKG